jgi:hypothetical protein
MEWDSSGWFYYCYAAGKKRIDWMTLILAEHNAHIRQVYYDYWRACPLIGGGAVHDGKNAEQKFHNAWKGRRRKVEWEVIKAGRVGGWFIYQHLRDAISNARTRKYAQGEIQRDIKTQEKFKKAKKWIFLPQYICIDFLITWFSGANVAIKGAPLHGVRTLKKSFYLLI